MKKNSAIFLDRDGTLNKAIIKTNSNTKFKLRPPYSLNEFELFKDIGLLNLYNKKYLLILISNQPDLVTKKQTLEFHNYINRQIKKNINLKDLFFCKCLKNDPKCKCYKPKSEMLNKAINKYNIDVQSSFLIGDTWRDIKMANSKNLKSILIDRGFYKLLKKEFIINSAKFDYKIKSFFELKNIIGR